MSVTIPDRAIGRHNVPTTSPHGVSHLLAETAHAFSEAMAATSEYRRLAYMSDPQLRHDGLTREGIAEIVRSHHF